MKKSVDLGNNLGGLSRLSDSLTRSISPENFSGEKGQGGRAVEGTGALSASELGEGWKVSPSVEIPAGDVFELAHIPRSGAIQHIWITCSPEVRARDLILRMYWDGQETPSVEVPLGDFFCCGWEEYAHVSSLAVCVNPGKGFNCYWEMPFRNEALVTLENRGGVASIVYYQITYALGAISEDCGYFHAQFRRSNPLPYKEDHVLADKIRGQGHYVGTYIAWGVNNNGWWGEGELKFFIDDDNEFPTICGTGTEDYFGGAYNFDIGSAQRGKPQEYTEYSTPYSGLPQVIRPDGVYRSQQRFGMYRWHVTDPIRFQTGLRVSIQALGWTNGGRDDRRYLPLQDDIASTVFWYQTLPTAPFPELADRRYLEVR